MRHKTMIKSALLLILLGLAVWTVCRYLFSGSFNYADAADYISSYGSFAAIIFILLFSARTLLVVFPYSIAVILGGTIFGPVKGFLYSMISIVISATMAFYLSRFLGKGFIEKILRGKVSKLDSQIENHGFKVIFYMRVSIIFPFDVLNYAAGLTKVKFLAFILGTVFGVLPETFSLTYLGANIKAPLSTGFLLSLLLVGLTVAVPFLYKKIKKSVVKYDVS